MIGTMTGDEKEIVIETEIEIMTETGKERETATAPEMTRIMGGIENEKGREIGETETVGGAGVAQGAGVVAGIAVIVEIVTVKTGTAEGGMPTAVLVLVDGRRRSLRSPRRRRKRKRRRATGLTTQIRRLLKPTGFGLPLV